MAELVRNPRVLEKAQDEVRDHVGNKGNVSESDLDKLQYLKMVIKETLRMHPVGPLLLPRETISHCKINGYDIEPNTMIQVNVWAIGRDPKYWKEPEQFYPERFSDNSIDYKGQNFEFLPFGGGRRMCVGIHMATVTVEAVLANLLYMFDWKLPEGMRKEDMNMEEKAGVSLALNKSTPLILVPPSPSSLPILRNLHQLSQLLRQSYSQLSKKHGPVMFLRQGQIPVVVVLSAEAARDVLKVLGCGFSTIW